MSRDVISVLPEWLDPDLLAASGLRPGQAVVAEATDRGLLLRPATSEELEGDAGVTGEEARAVLARYPETIARLAR